MAYSAPDAAALKARYPEFGSVADALVTAMLADAFVDVDATWIEGDRARAQIALVAHWLAAEGEPQRSATIAAGGTWNPNSAPMKRRQVGDVMTEFQNASERFGSQSNAAMSKEAYETSPYGREFLKLRARSFPAMIAV
ncbi:hypothetical protein CSC94_12710 [Zhengella mangrovi]|uniref:DUF4054 domain-containing protein n=1 Tax=Zhengella mangrovi TaxID=1982044 RepID=A0A2G1QM44_9HYPH|nr:DUF4054 domain-containing protein [Zhengella mangrovi]PHP66544.1 hypothetical protein CSC94_12710 [Zhengella mangrovi]